MILAPGTIHQVPAYTVKVNSKFPAADVALKGVILLFDLAEGDLMAIMDSAYLTALRTGLSAAMATNFLAPPQCRKIGIIGAGVQGEFQLHFLSGMRKLEQVIVYDIDPTQTQHFCENLEQSLHLDFIQTDRLEEVIDNSDILLVATWSKKPVIRGNLPTSLRHITTIGSDEKEKLEIETEILKSSRLVVDDFKLNLEMGSAGNAGLHKEDIFAEIGQLYHQQDLWKDEARLSVYSSVGLPFQDLVTAWHVYQKACRRKDIPLFNFS